MKRYRAIGVSVAMIALCVMSNGQSLGTKRGTARPKLSTSASSPVLRSEAASVYKSIGAIIARTILKSKTLAPRTGVGAGVESRTDVIDELYRLFQKSKGALSYTPRMDPLCGSLLSLKPNHPSRPKLELLVRWGFVDRADILATSTATTLTPEQFGDAVGYFLARLCELTHTPETEFTPAMMGAFGN